MFHYRLLHDNGYNSIVFILEVRYRLISSFHLGTILMCVHAGWRLCPRLLLSLSLCVASVYIGSMLRLTGSDHFLEELTWHVEAEDACWRVWSGRADTEAFPWGAGKKGGWFWQSREPCGVEDGRICVQPGCRLTRLWRTRGFLSGDCHCSQPLPYFFSSWLVFTVPLFLKCSLPWSAVTFLARLTFERGARRLAALPSEWQLLWFYPARLPQS